jgi:hypothetical protein
MPPKIASILLLAVLINTTVATAVQSPANQQAQAQQAIPKPAMSFGLHEDAPVRLRLTRNISSATEKTNDKVDFEVIEDVKVGDVVVIPHGAIAIATVTEAHPKRRMGRSGKLNVNIDYVQLPSGDKANLRAVKGGNGGSHTGAMTGAMIATGIVFFPAAPLFLFMHGKDINIPKGTEITAYVAADTPLDLVKFTAPTAPSAQAVNTLTQPSQTVAATDDPSTVPVVIKSEPEGADITINGKYVGATQSKVPLTPGEHTIEIEKTGYKKWSRVMTVSASGDITVSATLEKLP